MPDAQNIPSVTDADVVREALKRVVVLGPHGEAVGWDPDTAALAALDRMEAHAARLRVEMAGISALYDRVEAENARLRAALEALLKENQNVYPGWTVEDYLHALSHNSRDVSE